VTTKSVIAKKKSKKKLPVSSTVRRIIWIEKEAAAEAKNNLTLFVAIRICIHIGAHLKKNYYYFKCTRTPTRVVTVPLKMELSSLKRNFLVIKFCSERNLAPKKWNLCTTPTPTKLPLHAHTNTTRKKAYSLEDLPEFQKK